MIDEVMPNTATTLIVSPSLSWHEDKAIDFCVPYDGPAVREDIYRNRPPSDTHWNRHLPKSRSVANTFC
jgi:hypothetical protein